MYYFDVIKYCECQMDEKIRYDVLKFISSLQGLVNRISNRLYINLIERSDEYWLGKLRGTDGFLGNEELIEIEAFEKLVGIFANDILGVVLWDEEVPATANAAATICGVEGLIPVRYDEHEKSIYTRFVLNGFKLPVGRNLTGKFTGTGKIPDSNTDSTGSSKCDTYIWAKEQYLDKGFCNKGLMAYMLDSFSWKKDGLGYPDLDNTLLANHDYYIANKAFFFDLSPWGDETPNDDPHQPLGTDFKTMKEVLLSQYMQNSGDRITSIGGFTPWHVKYVGETNDHCSHGSVETEWHYAEILSAHNAMMDADAPMLCGIANASLMSRFPLKEKYNQNTRPVGVELENKTYILYYMGDYDSAAWISRHIPIIWDDPARGKIPLAWAFNPNLSDRVPHVFDYVYRTMTENDFFIAGDSGAGYINPLYLLEPRKHSELPTAMNVWIKHNIRYFDKFDLSITGFIINGHEPINEEVQKAYSVFSKDGVGLQNVKKIKSVVNNTVFHPHSADIMVLDSNMEEAAGIIYSKTEGGMPQFHIFRSVLCTPKFMAELTEKIKREHPERNYEVVDPYNFFSLLKSVK